MKVLAFGEVMMRLMVMGKKTLIQGNNLEYMFTGTGVNILGALGKMGHETRLLTKLSDDSIGESAKSQIMSLGIDTGCIPFERGYTGMYFLEEGFGLRSSKVTYSNRRESTFSQSGIEDYDIEKALEGVDLVHLCGISLAMNPRLREVVYALGRKAKERNIKVVFDFNYRPALWNSVEEAKGHYENILEVSDIVFATERDAAEILGMKKSGDEGLLTEMVRKYDLDFIGGTIRKKESLESQTLKGFVVDSEKTYYSKEYKFQVYDRIGGGDGFAAGLIHSYLSNHSHEKTAEFATVSGVLAHTNYGDTPISTVEDIEELLEGRFQEIKR